MTKPKKMFNVLSSTEVHPEITFVLLRHMQEALKQLTDNEACYVDKPNLTLYANFEDIETYINKL